jgi:hypothetical protein
MSLRFPPILEALPNSADLGHLMSALGQKQKLACALIWLPDYSFSCVSNLTPAKSTHGIDFALI